MNDTSSVIKILKEMMENKETRRLAWAIIAIGLIYAAAKFVSVVAPNGLI